MRRSKKSSGASLDSLLDTMTNVVGILVILLTVTQLGVGDAVERISATDQVKPEALDKAKLELAEIEKLLEELALQREAFRDDIPVDAPDQLKKLKQELIDQEADVDVLLDKKEAQQAINKRIRELQKQIEESEKKEQELRGKIDTGEEELASLNAQLSETPELSVVQPKVINLPDPRPAPKGATPLTYICREGRAFYVDVEPLRLRAQKIAAAMVDRYRLNGGPQAGVDGKRLTQLFNDQKLKDRDTQLVMSVSGRTPRITFKRIEDAGETLEQIQRPTSRYQQKMMRTNKTQNYLKFLVWPDSFEVYLEARKQASLRDLPAGWQGMTIGGEYTVSMGGPILCGPPPPPPPKPDPNKPQPPPKPKPPRPVPTDVID